MSDHEIAIQTLAAAKDSARWAYYALWIYGITALVGATGALVTLWAVLVARRGLSSWKDQHISTAKAEWIASLVSYAAGLSYLPETISWRNPTDQQHVEKIAELQYECIKRWKVLQTHLEQNRKLEVHFLQKYSRKWESFCVVSHNRYMDDKMSKTQLKKECIELYNT